MNKIVDFLIYVLSVIMVILILLFQHDMQMLFITMSICAIFLGILLYLKKYNYGTLITGIGISGVISFILFKSKTLEFDQCVTFMMSTSFGISCILTIIYNLVIRINFKKRYSMVVVGKVIDLEKNNNTKKEYYRPIYEYIINGDSYTCYYPVYLSKNIPAIGEAMPIYIDPNNYLEVYFDPMFVTVLSAYGISVFFAIMCTIIDITLFL